jgi:hypothetical protein
MKYSLMVIGLILLAPRVWAQTEKRDDKEGITLTLPAVQQVTFQGLYGENKLVRTGGSPLFGVTYSHFAVGEIHVGSAEDDRGRSFARLHLPNGGWFVDALTGSRAGARVQSLGIGGAVRLTSTSLTGGGVARDRWFYGAGLGLYATRVESTRNSTGVGLGMRLFTGKDFADGSLLELGYSYRPGTLGVHPSGLTLGIGRRF